MTQGKRKGGARWLLSRDHQPCTSPHGRATSQGRGKVARQYARKVSKATSSDSDARERLLPESSSDAGDDNQISNDDDDDSDDDDADADADHEDDRAKDGGIFSETEHIEEAPDGHSHGHVSNHHQAESGISLTRHQRRMILTGGGHHKRAGQPATDHRAGSQGHHEYEPMAGDEHLHELRSHSARVGDPLEQEFLPVSSSSSGNKHRQYPAPGSRGLKVHPITAHAHPNKSRGSSMKKSHANNELQGLRSNSPSHAWSIREHSFSLSAGRSPLQGARHKKPGDSSNASDDDGSDDGGGRPRRDSESSEGGVGDDVALHPQIELQLGEAVQEVKPVSLLKFCLQVIPSLTLSGLGMLGAGAMLDIVQHWDVFVGVSEMFILCPALLGLKGNLEMVLASRLSTAAHSGQLSRANALKTSLANLLLIQMQGLCVAIAAAVLSTILGVLVHHEFSLPDSLLLMSSSMLTASLASALLGGIMCLVVVGSHRFHIDPDNVATPIAAALGDLVTLVLLAFIGTTFYHAKSTGVISGLVLAFLLFVLLPLVYYQLKKHPEFELLRDKSAWISVLAAMGVSTLAGLMLERFVTAYEGIAVLAPLINGIGGSLAVVHASKISTALHMNIKQNNKWTGLILFLLTIPLSILFLVLINLLDLGHTSLTMMFLSGYLLAALVQVMILLGLSGMLVRFLHKQGFDPDQIAIPLITALGDVVGTSVLVFAFAVLFKLGDGDADVGE